MTRTEIMLRLGYYCGLISLELGDSSYAERSLGRAHLISDEEGIAILVEVQAKLVAAGALEPEEDPFTKTIKMRELDPT
jgi:hypothetical protein